MWQYIVLGQIPGTSLQISFYGFLLAAFVTSASISYRKYHRQKSLANQARTIALQVVNLPTF